MENRNIIGWILIGCTGLSSCEKADLVGMFVSHELVNERFAQSMEWNADHAYQEITVPDNTYTVYAMSDSHVGGVVNLNRFLDDAQEAEATAVLMVGDLTTGNPEDYATFDQNMPDPDSIAIFPMIGNHDLYFNGWLEYYPLFGSTTYYFTISTPQGRDLFICLDSGSGTLGSDQLEWLKDILGNERPGYRYCIISTHCNLFRPRHTSSTNPVVEELYVLLDLFARHRVNMVITGHDHEKNADVLGNTTHIILDALKDDYEQAGYLTLSIDDEGIRYDFFNY